MEANGALATRGVVALDRRDLGRGEGNQRSPEQPVEALVGEDEGLGRGLGRAERPASFPDPATDLEDVGVVHVEVQVQLDPLLRRAVVRDLDAFGEPTGDPAPAHDRDRAKRLGAQLVLLDRRVTPQLRIGQLDRADVIRRRLRAEQRRPYPVDPEDRARQHARVEVVQPQPARIGVDVAERVGEQEQVPVLEHADAAEVGGGNNRRVWRRKLFGLRRLVGAIEEGLRHGGNDARPGSGCHTREPRGAAAASQRRDILNRDTGLQAALDHS